MASKLSNDSELLTYIKEVESKAEEVLSDRREIVDLDRKRNQNREAIRALKSTEGQEDKTWLAMGNTFFKLPTDKAKNLIEKDQVSLDREINILRSNLKTKVNSLRDLEGHEKLKGFDLKALSSDEMKALQSGK